MTKNKKKALVTGATGGIGKEISFKLADQEIDLCLTGTNLNKLKQLKKKLLIVNKKINILIFKCDFSKEKNIDKLVKYVNKNFKYLDYLFNVAGIFEPRKINDENNQNINKMFQINVITPIYLSKIFSNQMKKRKFGRIVNIGSSSSYAGYKNTSIYCATKHALLGFSRSLHDELKLFNVRVLCISPGTVNTKMAKKIKNQNNQTFIEPKNVAKIIMHLLTYEGNMVIDELRLNRIIIK